jgi:hypothetical protein
LIPVFETVATGATFGRGLYRVDDEGWPRATDPAEAEIALVDATLVAGVFPRGAPTPADWSSLDIRFDGPARLLLTTARLAAALLTEGSSARPTVVANLLELTFTRLARGDGSTLVGFADSHEAGWLAIRSTPTPRLVGPSGAPTPIDTDSLQRRIVSAVAGARERLESDEDAQALYAFIQRRAQEPGVFAEGANFGLATSGWREVLDSAPSRIGGTGSIDVTPGNKGCGGSAALFAVFCVALAALSRDL